MMRAQSRCWFRYIHKFLHWCYASESTTVDLTFIAAKPFGRAIRKVLKAWHDTSFGPLSPKSGWHISRRRIHPIGLPKWSISQRACPRLRSGNAKTTKTIDALDWLAQLVSHIPNKGEQMVRYWWAARQKNPQAPEQTQTTSVCQQPAAWSLYHLWWILIAQRNCFAISGCPQWQVFQVTSYAIAQLRLKLFLNVSIIIWYAGATDSR